ncbi:hypothetical protein COBT_001486, partial [Conglomerata obtusa]
MYILLFIYTYIGVLKSSCILYRQIIDKYANFSRDRQKKSKIRFQPYKRDESNVLFECDKGLEMSLKIMKDVQINNNTSDTNTQNYRASKFLYHSSDEVQDGNAQKPEGFDDKNAPIFHKIESRITKTKKIYFLDQKATRKFERDKKVICNHNKDHTLKRTYQKNPLTISDCFNNQPTASEHFKDKIEQNADYNTATYNQNEDNISTDNNLEDYTTISDDIRDYMLSNNYLRIHTTVNDRLEDHKRMKNNFVVNFLTSKHVIDEDLPYIRPIKNLQHEIQEINKREKKLIDYKPVENKRLNAIDPDINFKTKEKVINYPLEAVPTTQAKTMFILAIEPNHQISCKTVKETHLLNKLILPNTPSAINLQHDDIERNFSSKNTTDNKNEKNTVYKCVQNKQLHDKRKLNSTKLFDKKKNFTEVNFKKTNDIDNCLLRKIVSRRSKACLYDSFHRIEYDNPVKKYHLCDQTGVFFYNQNLFNETKKNFVNLKNNDKNCKSSEGDSEKNLTITKNFNSKDQIDCVFDPLRIILKYKSIILSHIALNNYCDVNLKTFICIKDNQFWLFNYKYIDFILSSKNVFMKYNSTQNAFNDCSILKKFIDEKMIDKINAIFIDQIYNGFIHHYLTFESLYEFFGYISIGISFNDDIMPELFEVLINIINNHEEQIEILIPHFRQLNDYVSTNIRSFLSFENHRHVFIYICFLQLFEMYVSLNWQMFFDSLDNHNQHIRDVYINVKQNSSSQAYKFFLQPNLYFYFLNKLLIFDVSTFLLYPLLDQTCFLKYLNLNLYHTMTLYDLFDNDFFSNEINENKVKIPFINKSFRFLFACELLKNGNFMIKNNSNLISKPFTTHSSCQHFKKTLTLADLLFLEDEMYFICERRKFDQQLKSLDKIEKITIIFKYYFDAIPSCLSTKSFIVQKETWSYLFEFILKNIKTPTSINIPLPKTYNIQLPMEITKKHQQISRLMKEREKISNNCSDSFKLRYKNYLNADFLEKNLRCCLFSCYLNVFLVSCTNNIGNLNL